jgi:hypothetical protein
MPNSPISKNNNHSFRQGRGGGRGAKAGTQRPKPSREQQRSIIQQVQEKYAPETAQLAREARAHLQKIEGMEVMMKEDMIGQGVERHLAEESCFSADGPNTAKEAITLVEGIANKAEETIAAAPPQAAGAV